MILKAKPILKEFGLVVIAAETRTGKTLAAIGLTKDYEKVLVVTKKKAIPSWEKDIKFAEVNNFDVINYESIHKVKNDYDLIILDESHSIGSYPKPSKTAQKVKDIAKDKKIVYLTATPSAETFSQLYHQLWVSSFTPFEEENFYKWFKNYGTVKKIIVNGVPINNYKEAHEEPIMEKINHLIVTMTKEKANFDVMVEEKKHYIPIREEYYRALKRFEIHNYLDVKGYDLVAESPASVMSKLHQLTGGTIKINSEVSLIVSRHKLRYINENLSNYKKIVILCNYVKERDLLLEDLESVTDDPVKFKNEDYKYFVGHIKTYSEGVDFSYADTMIIYSLNFSATTYLQSKERLANKKRTKPIEVHYLFTLNSIDEYIYQAVSNKMNFTNRYYRSVA